MTSRLISLKKEAQHPNSVSVNVNPKVSIISVDSSDTTINDKSKTQASDVNASYSEKSVSKDVEMISKEEYDKVVSKLEISKTIIKMLQQNPLMYNGYIVADDVQLMKFVQLLTGADDVQMDAEDLGSGCLTKKTYRKVESIFVIKNGTTYNLKYDFPEVNKELKEFCISTKYVW